MYADLMARTAIFPFSYYNSPPRPFAIVHLNKVSPYQINLF